MLVGTADYKVISCTPSVITTKNLIYPDCSISGFHSKYDNLDEKSHLGSPLCQRGHFPCADTSTKPTEFQVWEQTSTELSDCCLNNSPGKRKQHFRATWAQIKVF